MSRTSTKVHYNKGMAKPRKNCHICNLPQAVNNLSRHIEAHHKRGEYGPQHLPAARGSAKLVPKRNGQEEDLTGNLKQFEFVSVVEDDAPNQTVASPAQRMIVMAPGSPVAFLLENGGLTELPVYYVTPAAEATPRGL